jgi:hypothetical protein
MSELRVDSIKDSTGSGSPTFTNGVKGIVYAPDGSIANPGISFDNERTSGIARTATNTFAISVGGNKVGEINSNGLQTLDNYVLVIDSKTNTTDGGTFTSGAWQRRDLTLTRVNRISGYSLSSNQVTLSAGTYRIRATAPAYYVNQNVAKWRNVTDGTDVLIGSVVRSGNSVADSGMTNSIVIGEFTIAGTKTFELQHRGQSTQINNGFGAAASFGVAEVYSQVEIWKLA